MLGCKPGAPQENPLRAFIDKMIGDDEDKGLSKWLPGEMEAGVQEAATWTGGLLGRFLTCVWETPGLRPAPTEVAGDQTYGAQQDDRPSVKVPGMGAFGALHDDEQAAFDGSKQTGRTYAGERKAVQKLVRKLARKGKGVAEAWPSLPPA